MREVRSVFDRTPNGDNELILQKACLFSASLFLAQLFASESLPCSPKWIVPANWVKVEKVIVLYSNPNCGPCKQVKEKLDELKIKWQDGSGDKSIEFYPTIVILEGNKETKRIVGSEEILKWARAHAEVDAKSTGN